MRKDKKISDLKNDTNPFGEFVPTYHAWMTPDELRDRAREVGESTNKKKK